jgi:hypothetical protein
MLRPSIMTKKSTLPPARPPAPATSRRGPAPLRNPNLNQQTRKVLAQHYRAKYGVK